MPLFAINLSDKLFAAIKELVEKGNYQSPESFLEIAAFNQLALERGATPAEIVARGHRKTKLDHNLGSGNGAAAVATSRPKAEVKPKVESVTRAARASPPQRVDQTSIKMVTVGMDEPVVMKKDRDAAFGRLALLPGADGMPAPAGCSKDGATRDRVFGQVNRLFPLKLACRWLAHNAASEGRWPKFEQISDRLADDAATIGSILATLDLESERKREELLSTALPRRGNSASRDRFLSQFLARVTRNRDVFPATICQYQLASFDDSVISLTDRGVKFSDIENPVLDRQDPKATAPLSPEEAEFLTRQIVEWVPVEHKDMSVVLKRVKEGNATPAELGEAVRPQFPDEWSDSVFQTHLSGLVARLGDLRLLRRNWLGRNVRYELGDEQQVASLFKV